MRALTYILLTQLCLAVLAGISCFVSSYIAVQRHALERTDTAARYQASADTCVLICGCVILFSVIELWFLRKARR